jgi:hypothetical protein
METSAGAGPKGQRQLKHASGKRDEGEQRTWNRTKRIRPPADSSGGPRTDKSHRSERAISRALGCIPSLRCGTNEVQAPINAQQREDMRGVRALAGISRLRDGSGVRRLSFARGRVRGGPGSPCAPRQDSPRGLDGTQGTTTNRSVLSCLSSLLPAASGSGRLQALTWTGGFPARCRRIRPTGQAARVHTSFFGCSALSEKGPNQGSCCQTRPGGARRGWSRPVSASGVQAAGWQQVDVEVEVERRSTT